VSDDPVNRLDRRSGRRSRSRRGRGRATAHRGR
jgi:hypothetical protein